MRWRHRLRSIGAAVAAVVLSCACGSGLALRGSPIATAPTASASFRDPTDQGRDILALPAPGEARIDKLHNGWPIWVIRHDDGAVSVIDAVGPRRSSSAALLFSSQLALVQWVAAERHFLAGDVLCDERGRVLGYASTRECDDESPCTDELALEEPNLTTFEIRVEHDRIFVGARDVAPTPSPTSPWVDYRHRPHVAHDAAIAAPLLPTMPIAAALRRPIGSFALVSASVVRSTTEPPIVCECAPCALGSPRVVGLAAVPISEHATEIESGTFLVVREVDGLSIIAANHAGTCHAR